MATAPASNPYAPKRMFPALAWLLKQRAGASAASAAAPPPPRRIHSRLEAAPPSPPARTPHPIRASDDSGASLRAGAPRPAPAGWKPAVQVPTPTPPPPASPPAVQASTPAGWETGGTRGASPRPSPQVEKGKAVPPSPTPLERAGVRPALSGEQLDLALLVSCLPERLHGWLVAQLQPLLAWRRAQPRRMADLLREYPPPDPEQGRLGRLRAELCSALLIGLATAAAPLEQVSRPTRNRGLAEEAERLAALAGELARRRDAEPLEQELYRALLGIRR